MKKLLIILLSVLLLATTACGGEENDLKDAFLDLTDTRDEGSDENPEEDVKEIPTEITGRYELVKVQRFDQEINEDDLAIRKMQDDYIYILENDEIELVLGSEVYPVEQLELIDDYKEAYFETKILKFDFSLEDGVITLYETDREETYIFEYNPDSTERTPYEELEFVPPVDSTSPMRYVDYISDPAVVQSIWYGTCTISEYVTEPELNGTYETQAIISHSDEGEYYFVLEVILSSSNIVPVAYFHVDVKEDTFYPIINDEAGFNGAPMPDESAITYAPTLKNGILSATYYLDDKTTGESGIFYYELARYEALSEKFAIKKGEFTEEPHLYHDEPVHTTAELAELFTTFDCYGKTLEELKEFYGGTQPFNTRHDAAEGYFTYYSTEGEDAYVTYAFTDIDGKMMITNVFPENLLPHLEQEAIKATLISESEN